MQILSFPNGWAVVKADGSTEMFKSLNDVTDFLKHGNHDQSSHGARGASGGSSKGGGAKGGASDTNLSGSAPATSNFKGGADAAIGDAAKEHGTSADWEKTVTGKAAERNISKLPMETVQGRAYRIEGKNSVEYADKAYAVQRAKSDKASLPADRAARRAKYRDAIMTTDAKTGVTLVDDFYSKFEDTKGGREDRNEMQHAFAQRHGVNYMVIDS